VDKERRGPPGRQDPPELLERPGQLELTERPEQQGLVALLVQQARPAVGRPEQQVPRVRLVQQALQDRQELTAQQGRRVHLGPLVQQAQRVLRALRERPARQGLPELPARQGLRVRLDLLGPLEPPVRLDLPEPQAQQGRLDLLERRGPPG